MKTLTLKLDDKTYEAVVEQAQRTGQSEEDVVRDAIASLPQPPQWNFGPGPHSYADIKPLGVRLKPGALNFDNLFDEMIDDSDRD